VTIGARSWIDVHAHYLPAAFRAALTAAGHDHPEGMPGLPAWELASMLETMDRLQIAAALLSIPSPGVHFGDDAAARALARALNEEGADAVREHPQRFGLLACLPLPDVSGALHELAYALDVLDADGVVLQTHSRGVYLGDARLNPVFEELDRRGAVAMIHPTSPPGWEQTALGYPRPILEFAFDTTRAVTNLVLSGTLARSPDVRIVVPHAGAALPTLADRVEGLAATVPSMDQRHIVDELGRLYYDLAGFVTPRQLPALLGLVGTERMLYGSDLPFTPEPVAAALADKLASTALLDAGELGAIAHDNALSLFPLASRMP
jgi:predicted TIM-barrel fold metal-dependent hydrolase